MTGKRVLVTGLHPSAVDFSNYPGWTADRLTASLDSEQATLRELGYSPDACWFNLKQPPESVLQKKLAEGPFDCVMIGQGANQSGSFSHVREADQHSPSIRASRQDLLQYQPDRYGGSGPALGIASEMQWVRRSFVKRKHARVRALGQVDNAEQHKGRRPS